LTEIRLPYDRSEQGLVDAGRSRPRRRHRHPRAAARRLHRAGRRGRFRLVAIGVRGTRLETPIRHEQPGGGGFGDPFEKP
jgi:hypothetical protein